jgi:replicative DNA helicase
VAARPSNGKTAFMLRCARNAGRRGVPSLLISLEQSVQSINERYLSAESEMDGMDIRAGRLNGEDMVSLAKAGESLAALPIYQDDSARLNVFDVCLKIRRQRTKEPELALVFIDYVQKLKATHTVENPRLEQALAAELLREIATELNIAVVCLSQLKRPPQGSEGRRPFLSDVKESGAWEEASDLVLILHRPELTRVKKTKKGETEAPETAVGYAECLVAKQRNGPIGLVRLGFVKAQAKFQDWNSGQDGGGFEE